MFEALFKYPLEYFTEGSLIFALPVWQLVLMPLVMMAPVFAVLGYFRLRDRVSIGHGMVITLFRSLALTLVIFSLTQPLLEVQSQMPQPNLVGVLLDNSVSMQIADHAGEARGDFIGQAFDAENGEFLLALQKRFDTRLFKFGEAVQAIGSINELNFADGESNINRALAVARESLKGEPLAGLVIISDGATASSAELDNQLLALRAAQIPVYSIAVGQTEYARDIEISRINLPRQVLKGNRVMAELAINQQGYDGQTVDLLVEDDSRIVHKKSIELQPGEQTVQIPLATEEVGSRLLNFRLANLADEHISANNSRQAVLRVDDEKKRILYFEGEPRFEFKFVRRAVADDDNLAIAGLVRTADAKYYRVGIESEKELEKGFPITREELFVYDAIILGSVEIGLLSLEQQALIVEFVSERGGALLMLGGRHAFAEGGYRDSLIQKISPIVMPETAQPGFSQAIKIQPTTAAWVHPALMLADNNEESMDRWLSLPPLTTVNPLRQIKPGATLLLTSTSLAGEPPYVVMASQRYGRGKVVAFAVQNSWIWQMHEDIELEDQTHERLWSQQLRWLVEAVPPQVSLNLSSHTLHTGAKLRLRSEVLQLDELPAELRAVLTDANGIEAIEVLSRHSSLPGVYETEITTGRPGDYQVRIEYDDQGSVVSSAVSRFHVTAEGNEYFASQMNEPLLRRIASETNGAFYTPDQVHRLMNDLVNRQRGSTSLVQHELWDMPIIFLLLVLLLCAEWGYRRWRNLI